MNYKKNFLLLLTLLLVLPSCKKSGKGQGTKEKLTLELKLKKGDSFDVVLESSIKTEQEMPGFDKQESEIIHSMNVVYDVIGLDDECATVKVTIASIGMKFDSPLGSVEYDSKNVQDDLPPVMKSYNALINQSYSFKWAKNGEIKEIQGVDKMIKDIGEKMELPDGPMKQQMLKQFEEQFGEKSIQETMNMFRVFPDKPVAIGDSWERKVDAVIMYSFIQDNKYTLKSRKRGRVIIDLESSLTTKPGAKVIEQGMFKIGYDISGKQKGKIEIDEATGMLVSSQFKQDLSGHLSMNTEGLETGSKGLEIPVTISGKSGMTVKKKK